MSARSADRRAMLRSLVDALKAIARTPTPTTAPPPPAPEPASPRAAPAPTPPRTTPREEAGPAGERSARDEPQWMQRLKAEGPPDPYAAWDEEPPEDLDGELDEEGDDRAGRTYSPSIGRFLEPEERERILRAMRGTR